jgi:hypothetical protein
MKLMVDLYQATRVGCYSSYYFAAVGLALDHVFCCGGGEDLILLH